MLQKIVLFLLTAWVVAAAHAQQNPPVARGPRIDFDQVEIKTTRHSDDFFTLEGHGGTISVLTGPDGVFMVDSQFAPLTDKIVAAIKKISNQPIRFLTNTHLHGDHTGGNENFAKLGTVIFARDQLRQRMLNPSPRPDGQRPPPAPAKALPIVTYDGPVTLHINGEDVQLIPIRNAHTDGDTLIRFVKHDILAVGDYYRGIGYPFVDIYNGGTLDGLLAGLDETIALAGPKTKIIPGHGAIVDRNAVIAHRDFIVTMRDRLRPLIARGMSVEEVLATHPTAATDASIPRGAETAEEFVRWMYAELSKPH